MDRRVQDRLVEDGLPFFERVLHESPNIRLLLGNGRTVVERLERIFGTRFEQRVDRSLGTVFVLWRIAGQAVYRLEPIPVQFTDEPVPESGIGAPGRAVVPQWFNERRIIDCEAPRQLAAIRRDLVDEAHGFGGFGEVGEGLGSGLDAFHEVTALRQEAPAVVGVWAAQGAGAAMVIVQLLERFGGYARNLW